MNKNVFRLVYSNHLGMFVPAPESASGNSGKASAGPARSLRRLLAAMMASSLVLSASLSAAAPLDGLVPTGGLVQGGNPGSWEGATYVKNGVVMDINQNIPKAILNWENLNLSNGETLNFNQASASWSALNRIHSIDPSNIAGNVNALGHVYFINSNGIIFGNGAQINVGSLTASSLNITDALFKNGFIKSDGTSNLSFEDTLNSVDIKKGFVEVTSGAKLNAFAGGRIMLLAPRVTNEGVINTPDGQTILAAGQKVYLASSTDPAGLLVEVSSGGTATNLGDIVSKLGNVTMVGLAVNQQGRVSASTSVRANGSVMLLARESIYNPSGVISAQRGGVLSISKADGSTKDSLTEIEVEFSDKEEILKSQLTNTLGNKVLGKSNVELSAGVININGSIVAHGGDVSAIAKFNPYRSTDIQELSNNSVSASRVYLGSDASIDVSGLDATAPMSRNQLAIQLYSEQLKDTPLLRGTDFLGKTIYVDARKGTDLIAADALEAAKAIKGVTIAEVMSKAGSIKLEASLGDVILASGSKIDVSGGSIAYESGFVRESQLLYKGNNIAISVADKDTPYEGFADTYSVTDKKWGVSRSWYLGNNFGQFNRSYTAGSDAGNLNLVAKNAFLQADLKGFAKNGLFQRDGQVLGGSFSFSAAPSETPPSFQLVADNSSSLLSSFAVVGAFNTNTRKFTSGSALPVGVIQVETSMFSADQAGNSGGFTRFNLNATAGNILVDAPVITAPKGIVSLNATGVINVNADVASPGGTVSISGGNTSLANNIKISTSGIYTNDTAGLSGAMLGHVVTDAGTIAISETNTEDRDMGLSIGQGVRIEANAGAWLNDNKLLTGGIGGSITLNGVASLGDAITSAYGFSKGGSLSLTAFRNIQAGGQPPTQSSLASTLWLPENFFGQGGFSQYTFKTSYLGSSILIGDVASTATTILPQTQTLLSNAGFRSLVSGSDMDTVASPVLQASYLRKPASIIFNSFGKLTLAENASLKLDAPNSGVGGSISLQSNKQMSLLGSLIAPAGNISAEVGELMNANNYDETLSLFVGAKALLSATGHYTATPSNNGLLKAAVSGAGSISLNGGERAVVVLKKGSLLDVSGVSGEVDTSLQSGYTRQTIDGSAGGISITARNGMVLDGDMKASASGAGIDGSLTLTFKGGDGPSDSLHPNGARSILLTSNKSIRGDSLTVGGNLSAFTGLAQTGSAVISAEQIMDAGFSRLSLDVSRQVEDKLLLSNGLNLNSLNSLNIKASLLEVNNSGAGSSGADVSLGADYVSIIGGVANVESSEGNSKLAINAKLIDLVGNVAVKGFNETKLNAELDIRGRGTTAGTTSEGSFEASKSLILNARQIYPVTNGAFRFQTYGNGSIEINSRGANATEVPLSAAGLLTLKAEDITQRGTLRAPLGQIVLEANNKLIFDAGSMTSVSAEETLIPFGLTRLGGLDLLSPTTDSKASLNGSSLLNTIAKKVSIKASAVEMNVDATVNISGGGDTLAYEWIQGIGGSSDILAKSGTFAVLPSIKKGEYAPFDYNYTQANVGINAGDSIHIAGVKGLADGDYALLPARYALLPGAFMVQTSTKSITQATSALQVDGSTLVSTYKSNGSYTDTNYSAFKVTDASIFHTPKGGVSKAASEYRLTYGNQFFTKLAQDSGVAIPRLSSDAGQLVINASNNLVLDATVLANKADTARGGVVDITSNAIKVVSAAGAPEAGVLQLTASSLNKLNAESLLLGGTRTTDNDGLTEIATGASRLEFANNNQNALSVKELIAVSNNTLTVASGSNISTAAASGSTGNSKLKTTGTGALLAVSSLNDLELERTGNTATGNLSIAADSNISASRSMVLDSRDTANLAGNVTVSNAGSISSNAGSISLGAGRILLGDSGSASGLKISNSLLSSFGQLAKVTLNSYKNIDIYGAVTLGNNSLDLTLNTGGIAGHMASDQTAKLSANNFILKNSLGAVVESASAASGSQLEINANNIQLVGGIANTSTTIAGFNAVQLNAAKEITVAGLGTTNINATITSLKSSRISAASAADFTIAATGSITTALADTQANLADASGLGAKLTMTAQTLMLGGKVDLPSGQLIAKASAGDLTVSATGQLKATSVPVKFDKYTEYTPAGSITLQTTGSGNVLVGEGALVDVSGKQASGDVGGDAGIINIISKGSTTINGNLKGLASAGNKAGDFVLDTNTLPNPNFTLLNTALNTGGFTNLREMRVRSGDVIIAATDTVTAQQVILSADAGKIDLLGTVNASGSNGGKIQMYASGNLTLKTGSKLLAEGTGEALVAGDRFVGAGGSILLSSLSASTSAISAESGALIHVSGDQQGAIHGEKGSVIMRAYRGSSNVNNVNVATTATAAVKGASEVRIEGVRVYNSDTFAADTLTIVDDTNAFYDAHSEASNYSATQDYAIISILPGIEVRSDADINLNDDINLRALFTSVSSLGGTLTLRAKQALNINGSLSDGFDSVDPTANLMAGRTFSYNMVAGADLLAANPMTIVKGSTDGSFNLAENKLIRTGSGAINIAANGDMRMGNMSSVIYTVGEAASEFEGFVLPKTADLQDFNNNDGITSASYLTNGGDINIKAQGSIVGSISEDGYQQLVNPWLFRQGGNGVNVSWWVRPDLFKQGVATLGGGDVTVNAGGSITNFSVSVPTTARFNDVGDVSLSGGGNLQISAGEDIVNGVYFAGKGLVSLQAGGYIKSVPFSTFGTTLALQDASAKVYGAKGASIETVFNPTMLAQSKINVMNSETSYFLSYGKDSAFGIRSLLGNINVGLASSTNITDFLSLGFDENTYNPIYNDDLGSSSDALEIHPGFVSATSFGGNINLGRLILSPSISGHLSLLAAKNVSTINSGLVVLSDADVGQLPTVQTPLVSAVNLPENLKTVRNGHASSRLHLGDFRPVVVVAKTGSVSMVGDTSASDLAGPGLFSSKAVDLYAGKDVILNAEIQHNQVEDASIIRAGSDFVMPQDKSTQIKLAGPGEILIGAGRNVTLGASQGIAAVANTLNPALPSQGASVTVLAGLGSEGSAVARYVASYINPNGSGPSTLQSNPSLLATYRSDTAKAVASYMRNMTGNSALSEDAAMTQYLALDLDRQSIFAYRHFSSELLASGKGYAESQNHNRGDNAIASLFPSDRTYKGDLSLYNSQIRTSREGSVDILTPGGFINAGVPTSSGNNIGIVTERGGAIRAFAETGFQVEQSKIITQYGSDITVWVNNGDIDAGRGSKTALSVPQRVVSTNADGKTTIEAKGAAAGSGIRAQTYDPDGPTGVQIAPPLGSVALIAPRGILNASEAGIAAGNFLAVATQVLGANNISVSGTSSGVPVASTGSVAGAMTGVSNAAADATKSIANDITRQATTNTTVKTPMPSLISVEVIGLGD